MKPPSGAKAGGNVVIRGCLMVPATRTCPPCVTVPSGKPRIAYSEFLIPNPEPGNPDHESRRSDAVPRIPYSGSAIDNLEPGPPRRQTVRPKPRSPCPKIQLPSPLFNHHSQITNRQWLNPKSKNQNCRVPRTGSRAPRLFTGRSKIPQHSFQPLRAHCSGEGGCVRSAVRWRGIQGRYSRPRIPAGCNYPCGAPS